MTVPVSFLLPKVTSAVWPISIRSTSYLPTENRSSTPSVEATVTASCPSATAAPSTRFIWVMMPSKSATMPPWERLMIRAISSYSSFCSSRSLSSTFWLFSLRSFPRSTWRWLNMPVSSSTMACQALYMAVSSSSSSSVL